MQTRGGHLIFLFLIVGAFVVATGYAYYRYVVLEDFTYFVSEEEIPDQLDPATYGL